MARQHCAPLLLKRDASEAIALQPVGPQQGENAVSEADIQAFVQAHPSSLPIREIDPTFVGAVPINTFVNVLRPRVRSAVADYQATQSAG